MKGLQRAFENIDELAELRMNAAKIPGLAMAVTDREKTLWVSAHGFADLATQAPIVPDSLFEIGSVGKSFTSIALLQLRDEGKVDLHAPVTQYLPWFQVRSQYPPITVHHLMSHTAGIIRGTEMAPHGLYDSWALRDSKTSAPPGQHWHYSSLGYKTLGFLLERLTGQSYQDVIRTRVLDSLGMTQTHPAITFETRKKTAVGYCGFYDDRPEHPSHALAPAIWTEFGTGDGCLASTVGDLAVYLRMLLNRGRGPRGRLISEESFGLITESEVAIGNAYYSYGLVEYQADGHTYLSHVGATAGFMSSIVADTEEGLGVVSLSNRMGEADVVSEAAQQALGVLRAAYHHQDLPPLPAVVDPRSINNASDYVGDYHAGDALLQITAEGGKLLLKHDGVAVALERRPQDRFNDRFHVGHPDLDLFLLEFKRDNGRVVEAFHGADWYINSNYAGPQRFDYPEEWEAYPGHYRARNPEMSNFRVVLRKGALALVPPTGAAEPLQPLGDGSFRLSDDRHSPETLHFDAVMEGRALRADYSGCPYYRTFTP